jgi:hypothetical protein
LRTQTLGLFHAQLYTPNLMVKARVLGFHEAAGRAGGLRADLRLKIVFSASDESADFDRIVAAAGSDSVTHWAGFSVGGLLRRRRSNSVYGPRSAPSLHLSRLMPLALAAKRDVLTRQQVQIPTAIRFVPNAVKPPHKVVEVANIRGTSWSLIHRCEWRATLLHSASFQKCQALFVPFFEIQKGHDESG